MLTEARDGHRVTSMAKVGVEPSRGESIREPVMIVDLRASANVFDHDHTKPPVGNPSASGLGVLGGDGGGRV